MTVKQGIGMAAWLLGALAGMAAPMASAGPAEDSAQAEKEFARGNLIVAIATWRKAADQGYAPAQARLGDILDKSEDNEEAVTWYRKAADQGDPAGLLGLGMMYGKGEGVQKDLVLARDHVRRAAEKDYLPAVIVMAEMYKNGGLGAVADPAQSEQWRAKAKQLAPKETAAAAAAATPAPAQNK